MSSSYLYGYMHYNSGMGQKKQSVMFKKLISGVLLSSFVLGLMVTPISSVMAAQVVVDSSVSTATTEHTILGSASVWVTDQVGYKFYVNSTGVCVYSKSTNGGSTWGIEITVDSDTTCFGPVVWYDRWTPGDGGDYIHILSAETADDHLWYNRLDTTNDKLLLNSTPISVATNTSQTGTISAGNNNGSITKGTNGVIYAAMNDNTDSYVVECSLDCHDISSWTETGSNPMDPAADFSILMPLPDDDILLINRDISADDIRSKVWDDSAGSWSGSWTTVDGSALENGTYDPGLTAAVDKNTGAVYIAYIDWATTGALGGNNDDIRTATYSGGWTNNADVITNTARGMTGVTLGVDDNTGDVYVGYSAQGTAGTAATGNVYWKRSTDGMTSWGGENGPVNSTADDIYGVDINNSNYQRLTLSWYGATPDDMFVENALADLQPVLEVGTRGLQNPEVRASTTNFYLGGTLVIKEASTTRSVTDVTITENGTVDAANSLDNIRLLYDVDSSAPYDCASESYDGDEDQFGDTDTDGFSSANGSASFSDSVLASTTQSLCMYVVVDVLKSASSGETIEVGISDPVADVIASSTSASPNHPINITGTTEIKLDNDFRVQRGVIDMNADTYTISAGVHYDAPASSTSAFIRITNTAYTGAGPDIGSGTRNADDVTVYITNPENITDSITFQRGTGAVNTTRVAWEIVEYKGVAGGDNEFVVRQQEDLPYVSGSLTLTTGAVSGILDDSDVAVFITGQYNSNTGATVYHRGISTANWNTGPDTVTFTRGGSGSVVSLSYAVVEFTGANWKVQRISHTYSLAGSTETEPMTAINSLSRAFIHVQKRAPASTHANFGHEVWLSGLGQVSFLLDAAAASANSHVSVAWVIENIQVGGNPMVVTRSNGGFNTTGVSPQTNLVNIGTTLDDTSNASIFTSNRADTTNNTWPEPILAVRIVSNTQYEIWRSDITANVNFRTEVIEWPTAERKIEQRYYRLYVDNDAITPTDPWPAGATDMEENAEMTATDEALALGDQIRIRMALKITGASLPAETDLYKLQFGKRSSTCTAVSSWSDLGDSSSTTALWRGADNTPDDGDALSTDPPAGGDLLVSFANISGTYEESNNTASNPYTAFPNDQIEYDWVVEHNGADDKSSYCFRMIESDGTAFQTYTYYPTLRTVGYEPKIADWRWYDDEASLTPSSALAVENVAPSNVANQNALKLRLVLEESSGADGENIKFAVQFSEYADFSQSVTTLVATTTCLENSLWCYYDGAGVDNARITTAVISGTHTCTTGAENGCGTVNEGISTTTATFDQLALTNSEFEFTLLHAGARVNTVYYFRLYDVVHDEAVTLADGASYPSLVTEGASVDLTSTGISPGATIAGLEMDATTTATAVIFGSLPFGTTQEAAQQFTVDSNGTEGYQMLMFSDGQLQNDGSDEIPAVNATNTAPAGWSTVCTTLMSGCFGYHTTDATLKAEPTTRFAPDDSYAALATIPQEIMYASIPTVDTYEVVYRIYATELQPPGNYTTNITYIITSVH
jgi:hypothetical protein